jgi:hypothetical protein
LVDARGVTQSTAIHRAYIKIHRAVFGAKRALDPTDRTVAWLLDHEDPRVRRPRGPSLCGDADVGQRQRHQGGGSSSRTGAADAIPAWRRGVRLGQLALRATRGRCHAGHSSTPRQEMRRSLRQAALPRSSPRRERVLPPRDFRPLAIRYDKLAANFLSTVAIATAIASWL